METWQPDVIRTIEAAVGKPVKFKYPGSEGVMKGVLKERTILPSDGNLAGIPYWDVVDLIEFPDAPEPRWLRIAYYRKKPGDNLRYASQYTITEPLGIWQKLLAKAAREQEWFAELLREVVDELKK